MPLTVCLVAREETGGSGVRRYVDRLDEGLGLRGINVVRLATTPQGALSRVLGAARHVGADLNTFLSQYPVRLAWPPADVYHLTTHTYAAALVVAPPPGPTVVTVHDIGPFLFRDSPEHGGYRHGIHRWFDSVAIHALANVDEILSDSEWTRRTLIDSVGLPEDRITVTLLGVDHAHFRPFQVPRAFRERYGLPDRRPFLVYVGNDEPRKNLETIWRALPIIRKVEPEVVLLKVGPSPIHSRRLGMRQLASDLGIADAIRFIDDVPEADLPSFYNLADVVLIPSVYEGFGLPALEALACARPVVVSSAPALIEVTGDAATVVEARDASGLATAALHLLLDPAAAQELGQRGRERSMQFTWPLTVDRTIEVYRRVSASTDRSLGSLTR